MMHSISSSPATDWQLVQPSSQIASTSLIDELNALEELHQSWTALQWHPNADIEFYADVIRGWSERCRPHVLVIRRNGRPEAMLVGRAEAVSVNLGLGYKTLFKVRARQLTFIYGGLLGDFSPRNSSTLIEAVQASLKRREADLAEFHFIRADSDLYGVLSATGRIRYGLSSVQLHRSTTLADSVEGMYRKLSPKVRKNLRWQEKKLLHDFKGKVNIRCFCHRETITEMFSDIESIARTTYHRQLGAGFDGSKELRQRLAAEVSRGRLRAFVLYLASQPAAFWIATAYGEVLYSDFMGYDPIYAKYSPGMYLLVKTLEDLCAGESDPTIRKVDWGLGDAQYKEVLGDSSWMEANVRIFGSTLRGVILRRLITTTATAEMLLRRILVHCGVLQKVKTLWRRRLVGKQVAARH